MIEYQTWYDGLDSGLNGGLKIPSFLKTCGCRKELHAIHKLKARALPCAFLVPKFGGVVICDATDSKTDEIC